MDFVCDFCNTVVNAEAGSCPNCGLEFSNTRCPRCGLVGSTKLFNKGCPNCLKIAKRHKKRRKKDNSKDKDTQDSLSSEEKSRFTPMLKFLILIFGISLVLVWYITYVELFK